MLRARFTPVPDGIRTGFALTSDDIAALTDGNEITLHNDSGESVFLLVLTDFRDFVRDPVLIFRQSNPFGAAVVGSLTDEDLAEFGYTGTLDDANFAAGLDPDEPPRRPPRAAHHCLRRGRRDEHDRPGRGVHGAGEGPHALCARPEPALPEHGRSRQRSVPTSVSVRADGTLLVTTLGGFPFAPGTSSVWNVDPATAPRRHGSRG